MEMLFMTPICLKVTLYDGDTRHDFILCRFSICTTIQMQNRSNVVIIFKRAFTKFSFRRNTLIFQEGIRKCHCRLYNFHKNVEIFCPTSQTQPVYKKYSSKISCPSRRKEIFLNDILPHQPNSTRRKEIFFKHDLKVGLVVQSVQYSTYTKTIVRIPTVYQFVVARENCQSKKKLLTSIKQIILQG